MHSTPFPWLLQNTSITWAYKVIPSISHAKNVMPLHKESDILERDPFSSWIKLLTRDKCRLEEEIIKKNH